MKRGDFFKQMMQEKGIKGMSIDLCIGPDDHHNLSMDTAIAAWEALDQEIYQDPKADLCEPKEEQQKPKANGRQRINIDMGKVHALHKAGWTYEAIAEELGCSAGTISMRLKEERDEDNAQRDICVVC